MKWRPRFRWRTLILVVLLATSALGLWRTWGPWHKRWTCSYENGAKAVLFLDDGESVGILSKTVEVDIEGGQATRALTCLDSWTGTVLRTEKTLAGSMRANSQDMISPRSRKPLGDMVVCTSRDGRYAVALEYDHKQSSSSYLALLLDVDSQEALTSFVIPHDQNRPLGTDVAGSFSETNGELVLVSAGEVNFYQRSRPESVWGVASLPGFWLTAAFAGLFVWSVVRDRRALGIHVS